MSDVQRAPAAGDWRAGAGVVLVVTVEVDGEAALTGRGEHHAQDLSAVSHHAYGPRVGLPRILQLLGQTHTPGTFFVPGTTAEKWPKGIEAIALAGHEIALHGHTHRPLTHLSQTQQRADLEHGRAALQRIGSEPRGYRAPYSAMTRATLDQLAAHGIAYDSSLMDDDRPYRLRTAGGPLTELPITWELDDTASGPDAWLAELDALAATGSIAVLTLHDYVSGRPSKLKALAGFLTAATERSDVRLARADRVADVVGGLVPALR